VPKVQVKTSDGGGQWTLFPAMTDAGVLEMTRGPDDELVLRLDPQRGIAVTVDVAPNIQVTPARIDSQQDPNSTFDQVSVIANTGSGDLGVSDLFESTDQCASAGDVAWLSFAPTTTAFTVPAYDDTSITVTLNSTGISGTQNASLCLASNDPDQPSLEIPISLEVLAAKLNRCSAADFNSDNEITALDLGVVFSNWGKLVTPGTNGDFDGNGVVNGNDYIQVWSCLGVRLDD
jgi:hypothetical protein